MNALQELQAFWGSFGLPAYNEQTVPDDAQLPYITYEASEDFFGSTIAQTASLWYYGPSWVDIMAKKKEVADRIGRGGIMISCDEGAFWLKRGEPWAQPMTDLSDDMIRRIVLNLEVDFLT